MDSDLQLSDLVAALRWRWRLIAIVTALAVLVVAVFMTVRSPSYSASADVLLLTERNRSAFDFTDATASRLAKVPESEVALLALAQPDPALPSDAEITYSIPDSTLPDNRETTDSIRFHVAADSRQRAAELANELAGNFVTQSLERDKQRLTSQLGQLGAAVAGQSAEVAMTARLERAEVSLALSELAALDGGARIIRSATIPSGADGPSRLQAIVTAAVLGLLLGVVAAAIREWASDVARDPQKVELATGYPVFASLPSPWSDPSRSKDPLPPNLTLQYRGFIDGLGLTSTESIPSILCLAATEASTDVGSFAIDVARIAERAGRLTTIIESSTNSSPTRLSRLCGVEVATPLEDLGLKTPKRQQQATPYPGLSYLRASTEWLGIASHDRIAELVNAWEGSRLIIVVGVAELEGDDLRPIAKHADAVVVIYSPNATSVESVRSVGQKMQLAGASRLEFVSIGVHH